MRLAWSIVVVLAAVFAARQFLPWDSSETRESLFLQTSLSLLDHAESNAIRFHDVAVGYNTNADLVADAVSVLKKLGHDKPPRKEDRVPVDKVSQLSDFTSLVSYFMTQGSAAERIIVDRQVCGTIATAARDIGGVEHIGGNAALIAMRMAEHTKVWLAGNLPSTLKALLHPHILLLEDAAAVDPREAHLILEYKKGQAWGDIIAPRANRVIVHCDRTNAEFKVVKSFHSSINNASDLVVLSGLHLLDQETTEIQRARIDLVLQQIAPPFLPATTPVHLELASMGNLDLAQRIGQEVAPNVNSLGLNEQELGFIFFALTQFDASLEPHQRNKEAAAFVKKHFTDPEISLAVLALSTILSNKGTSPYRHLERIHFHSLKYHIVASTRGGSWKSPRLSVIHGSLAATQNACDFSSPTAIDPTLAELLASPELDNIDLNTDVATANIEFAVAPVLVCSKPIRTVGLGDSISAAGLLHHEFSTL